MHEKIMAEALKQAKLAEEIGEVPVGAVIVKNGEIISTGYNLRESKNNPLMHAEIIAINNASKALDCWRLEDCDIYITLEPCPMCAGAIINSRIRKIFFGAYDPKNGCCGSVTDLFALPFTHKAEVLGGISQQACSEILSEFFKKLR